jgi:peptidylprolyl isomerase
VPTEKRQRQKEGHRVRREAALAAARRQNRNRRIRTISILVAAVVLISVLAATFGSNDDGDDTASSTTSTEAPTTASTTAVKPEDKPVITAPSTPAPTTLQTKDLEVGDGDEVKLGDKIEVNYVGVTYADGKQFDASWDKGSSIVFDLVEGGLIKGWTDGIPGMKVGGRRELIIPGDLAYGNEDKQDGRPFGTLIFVVDVISIQ